MLIKKVRDVRLKVRAELESPAERRRVGTGWLSGVAAFVASVAGLFFVLCLRYPNLLTVPQIRGLYGQPGFRWALHGLLLAAFGLAVVSLILRANKVLGFVAITVTLLATILGGSRVPVAGDAAGGELATGAFFGLDWFVLNVLFTGFLFVPIERLFARHRDQPLFRTEWREDLFYYLVSSLFVQAITFLSMAPAMAVFANTAWGGFRAWVASQPLWLQILEVMFLTDLVQYWVHRTFHRVPFLWKFHAVHHSAQTMDWMAGARMHFVEILVLRGLTVMPMVVLGFGQLAVHAYVLIVYVQSTFVHANVGWTFDRLGPVLVTPRYHHWHHGIEKEAIDVNFAIHFPLFDRLFGTYHLPEGKWPVGYGIDGHPVPKGYWRQFWYPFKRKAKPQQAVDTPVNS
jgi:sterol desaturase/sphingolipid hydroxylase (fatty acid hydroxylase superfamily)